MDSMLQGTTSKLLLLFAGGGAGTVFRYLVSSYSGRLVQSGFPVGTAVVNLSGSFLIGLLWAMTDVMNISPNLRALVFIGFIGGYTTFSTFMIENLNLIRSSEVKGMVMNLLLNNILGLVLVIAGFMFGKYFINLMRG